MRPLAGCLRDPDAFYHGWRLLALDGTTFTVANTAANARSFARAKNQHRASGYPLVRVVALGAVGTHVLIAWILPGYPRSEQSLAKRLLRRVPADSLLLADRNFHAFDLGQAAHQDDYALLIRVQKGPKLPIQTVLADDSYRRVVSPRRGKPQSSGPSSYASSAISG